MKVRLVVLAAASSVVVLPPALAHAKTLRYASQDDPQTLDPHAANLLAASRLLAQRELPVVTIHQPLIPWAMRRNVSAWMSPVNTVYFRQVKIE